MSEPWAERMQRSRMAKAHALQVLGRFSPDQPRDDHGRWTDGGGSGDTTGDMPTNDGRLSKSQEEAVAAYQGGGSTAMNKFLRGEKVVEDDLVSSFETVHDVPKAVHELQAAISRSSLPVDLELHRGFTDQYAKDVAVGQFIEPKIFFSTTKDFKVAHERGVIQWMENHPDETAADYEQQAEKGAWVLTFKAPAGTSALDIESMVASPTFRNEREVIFNPGLRLKVSKLDEKNHRIWASLQATGS